MSTGAWVVVVAVVAALAFGGYRLLTDGRFRGTRSITPAVGPPGVEEGALAPGSSVVEEGALASGSAVVQEGALASGSSVVEEGALAPVSKPPAGETPWTHVAASVPDARLGERATLLQFSSAFCAPCRATRRTLADVAGLVPGVVHVEVDAEHHLELVRTLRILRTPTTLVLDSAGREVTRATGAPRKDQVLAALGWA